MNKKALAKILAIIGTVLVWLTILSPVFFGFARWVGHGSFHFDYLMPAEFFLVALLGAGLLVLAAILGRKPLKWIAWGTGLAIIFLFGSQALAVATGLADGSTPPGGWEMVLVSAMLGVYVLCLVLTGVGGVILIRSLGKSSA